ncbi:hypothetical protein WA158_001869 [Blastocystis sp. Blastoise]
MFGFKKRLEQAKNQGKVIDEVKIRNEINSKMAFQSLQKWLADFCPCSTYELRDVNLNDPFHFIVVIKPDMGLYKGGIYCFSFTSNDQFPYEPPKVICQTQILHPNISFKGNVCLDIIRERWTPAISLENIAVGLRILLEEPVADDALNIYVKDIMERDIHEYETMVEHSLKGESITIDNNITLKFPKFLE